eukprot:jgi/Tetstr1/420864/TSEL_011937.t1
MRHPSLFKPRRDEADLYFTEANKTASRDEYQHVLCYDGLFHEATESAATTAMAMLRDGRSTPLPAPRRTYALDLLNTALGTFAAVGDTHLRGPGHLPTPLQNQDGKSQVEEQVAERLIYSRIFGLA